MALLVFFKRREKGNRTDHLNPRRFTPCRGAQGMFAASLKGSCRRYFKRNVDCRETVVARLINRQLVDSKIIQDYFISVKML